MADAQPVARYRLMRFDATKSGATSPTTQDTHAQLMVAVIQDGSPRLTDSTGVLLNIDEPFTAQEFIGGLRDLANDLEGRLA